MITGIAPYKWNIHTIFLFHYKTINCRYPIIYIAPDKEYLHKMCSSFSAKTCVYSLGALHITHHLWVTSNEDTQQISTFQKEKCVLSGAIPNKIALPTDF